MVSATRDMAFHTQRLADAEAERRSAERRAYLRVVDRALRGPLRYSYACENLGAGPATDVEILYRRDRIQTVLRRAEVAPGEQWRISDSDLESHSRRVEGRLPRHEELVVMRLDWSDAGGRKESETYVWGAHVLQPDVRPSAE